MARKSKKIKETSINEEQELVLDTDENTPVPKEIMDVLMSDEDQIQKEEDRHKKAANQDKFYVTNANLLREMYIWRDTAYKCSCCGQLSDVWKTKFDTIKKNSVNPDGSKKKKTKEYREKELNEWTCEHCHTVNDVRENGVITNNLGLYMMQIAQKITNCPWFKNYSQELKEDMAAYSYEKIIKGLANYNYKYTNVHSYFTQACFNSFKSILSKHYNQINIKRSLTKRAIMALAAEMPNSSMERSLNNQFIGNDYDDFSEL